jgi:hypothetical protein
MTDSNHAPNPSAHTGPPDYEGTDPDLPDRKKENSRVSVSTVQVGASAAAAVTSALAASFFGVAGTLIGAAVGSIVSTIAGSLYTHYLGRAGERIKVTKDVVIQRIPGEVIATTPLRHLTNPSALPGRESLTPIGDERGDESVAVPVEEASELLRRPEGMAPLDQTSVLPAYGSTAGEAAFRAAQAAGRSGAAGAASNGAGHYGPAGNGTAAQRPAGAPAGPAWKKPVLAMAGVSAAGFLIALGVVLATETAIGHPVSGGDSGTTISNLGNTDKTSSTEVTPTEQPTDTQTATVAPSSQATSAAPVAPTASTDPAATGGTDQGSTEQPSAQSTDPGAAATEPGAAGAAEVTPAP